MSFAGVCVRSCFTFGLAFVVLKLCGVIDWSWWWVTSPCWGLVLLCAVLYMIVGILVCHCSQKYTDPEFMAWRRKSFSLGR